MSSSCEIRSLSRNSINETAKKITFCPSLNCFVVINERDEYYVSDSSMESIFGPINSGCQNTIVAEYCRNNECLIIVDERKLNIRRDIGGTFFLKTAMNERFRGCFDEETEVDVEFTSSEAVKLLQYLLSPGIKLSTDKARDVLAQLRKQLPESKDNEKNVRSGKWSTVVVRGEYGFLHTMFSSIVSDLRQTNSRTAVLPVAAAVVERLNLMKDEPYSFELNAEGSGYEKSSMASEAARRMTLARWPHMNYKWCLPDQMAEAGFYHQPNNGGDDRVMCFMCNVCLVCWEPSDEPWSEHERHSPNCAFIREEYTQNVPISVTYASITALDHGGVSDISCVSSQSNCDWIATSTHCGEVVLWNVAKELQKTDVIVLDPSDSFVEIETGYRPRATKSTKVAWADDSENINFFPYGSPEAVVADSLREFIDMSANEIANEIVAVCPQEGDIHVTALCCVGKPSPKKESQDFALDLINLGPTTAATCTPSMIVGCGILEAKLQQHQEQQQQRNKNAESSSSSSSPMSSFVQNLNTVNKSKLGEVILAPPDRTSCGVAEESSSSSAQQRAYRPFILVYKIEEIKDNKRRAMQIGLNQDDKNNKSRTNDVDKSSSSMAKSLNDVFGFGGQSGEGFGHQDSFLDNSDSMDGVDDSAYGKDALIEAAMDLNYEMVNFMNNNSTGGFGKFPLTSMTPVPTPPMLTDDMVGAGIGETTPFSSTQSSSAVFDTWPPVSVGGGGAFKPSSQQNQMSNHQVTTPSSKDKLTVDSSPPVSDDLLKIEYYKPKVNLVISHCIRLPSILNDVAFTIHSITPSVDGTNIFVVINRNVPSALPSASTTKVSSTQIFSAILVYPLTFNGAGVGVQERPLRQCLYDHDVGTIKNVVIMPKETFNVVSQKFENVIVLSEKGEILVVDVENGRIITRTTETFEEKLKFSSITYVSDDKIGATTEGGEVFVLEIWTGSKRMEESLQDFYEFNEDIIEELKDPDLLVNKPMTYENLKTLWELTRSEMSLIGSQWCVQAPSCWIEVQQHQRLRKCPQHYLREEKMTRSWHIVTDNDTWKEHIFEMNLPANYCINHIDFKFTLRQNTPGPPFVQVTLLQQLPRQLSRSSSRQDVNAVAKGVDSASSSDAEQKIPNGFLKNRVFDEDFLRGLNAKIVCGPIDLAVGLDLNDQSGLIQFSTPLFSYSKNRTFLIHIQATCEESETKKYKKRVQHKKVARIAEQNSLKEIKTPGMFYQKYGATKAAAASPFGKTLQPGLKVIHQKNISDMKKLEDLRGCDWIQEISLTLWKAKKISVAQDRKQRIAMIQNSSFHETLLKLFAGESTKFTYPNQSWFQYVVVDILTFVVSQVYSSSNKINRNIAILFSSHLDNIVKCVFLSNSRSIARKFAVFVAFLFRTLKSNSGGADVDASLFLNNLKTSLLRFLKFAPACQSAGCLLWLFVLLEQMFKFQPTDLWMLSEELLTLLRRLGQELVKKTDSLHQILFNKYGLCGLPFDLEMFELPFPTLQLVSRPQQPFSYAAATAHGNCLTANFVNPFGNDEIDWADVMGIEYAKSLNSVVSPRKGKMIRLDREHLYGLLEVEPLQFTCQCSSEGIRLENLETGLSVSIQSGSVASSSGPGPIPIPDISQYETMQAGNPALANAVTSMKQQVQNILSKQMQLLALQQEKQKLQGNLQDHVALLAAEPTSTTQASSASTFGVPTTPKTTPFMTPTPLSPYQLSPVSSEANIDSFNNQFSSDETTTGAAPVVENIKDETLNLVPLDLLKPPSPQALLIDRMNSGARKFVVLNFGRPILLTDFILPQCSDLGSLSIDVWLKSETIDGQRLIVCSDIGRKSFVACDLQPPALCQFLKITYIGRYGLGSCSSKIPLGCFYGYTYLLPWQLDMAVDCTGDGLQQPANHSLQLANVDIPLSLDNLRQLAEDLRCRYSLACCFLKDLLEQPARLWEVTKEQNFDNLLRDAYKECMQVKLQYNLIQRTVSRLSAPPSTSTSLDSFANAVVRCSSLSMCSMDKLRVMSELVFGCLLRLSSFCKLESTPSFHVPLDLDATVEIFEQFCMKGPVSLQALCSIWVLQQAGATEWWGNFFAEVLDKFRSDVANIQWCEKVFLILSYLVERSVAAGNDFIFSEILNRLDSILSQADVVSDRKIIWLIMLLSTGFDYFPRCKIVGDRWNFVLGEYSRANFYSTPIEHDARSTKFDAKDAVKISQTVDSLKAFKFGGELNALMEKSSVTPKSPNVKVAKTVSSSSRSTTKQVRRSRKSTLRLPQILCARVVKKLAACILHQDLHLTAENFVLFAKVLSAVARCSRPYLHLMDVFSDVDVKKLVDYALSSRNVCVRHSFVCLIQDFLEGETSCVRRRALTASLADLAASSSKSNVITSTSVCPPTSSSTEDTLENVFGSNFNMASSSTTPSFPVLTVSNDGSAVPITSSASILELDSNDIPDTPSGAQQMIENLVSNAEPEEISSSKADIDKEKRRKELRNMCKESIYSKLANGMPFKHLKNWIKSAQSAEKAFAEKSMTVQQYEKQVQKYVQLHNYGKEYVMDILGNAIFSSSLPPGLPPPSGGGFIHQISWADVSPPPSFGSMGPPPPDIWVPSLYHSFANSLSQAGHATDNLSQAKDALSKLCEHLQTSAASASAMLASSTVSNIGSSSHDNSVLVDLGPLDPYPSHGSVSDIGATSSASKVDSINTYDSDSSSVQLESDNDLTPLGVAEPFSPTTSSFSIVKQKDTSHQQLLNAELLIPKDFSNDVDVTEQLNLLQPISTSLDDRMESQFGWRYEVEVRRWLLNNNSTLKWSLKTASPMKKPPKFSLVRADTIASHVHLSSSGVLGSVLSSVFESLTAETPNDCVENLLQLFWALTPKQSSKKRADLDMSSIVSIEYPQLILADSAVESFMNWLIESVEVSERVWTLSLKTLTFCAQSKDSSNRSTNVVVNMLKSDRFKQFLTRFFRSTGSLSVSGRGGPVVAQTFFDLLQAINFFCLSSDDKNLSIRFKTVLIQCLEEMLSLNCFSSIETCPLEVLTKLIEFLQPQHYKTVDVDLIVRLTLSAATSLRYYLNSCNVHGQPMMPNGSGNPRYCFRLGKSELMGNNEFRSYHDPCDVCMIALVKLIDKFIRSSYLFDEKTGEIFCDESSTDEVKTTKRRKVLAELLINKRREIVTRLLSCLSLTFCDASAELSLDVLSRKIGEMDVVNVVTIADGVLLLLVGLDANGTNSNVFLECIVDYLRSSMNNVRRTTLTEPLTAFLCYVLNSSPTSTKHFIDVNGLEVLARKFLEAGLPFDSEIYSEESQLLRKAASLCANVQKTWSESTSAPTSSSTSTSTAINAAATTSPFYSTPKKLSQMQVEGMTNFAPLCQIASSSPMAHHLTALLNSTPQHRRTRSAAWSYHFYPAESWLDVTLSLPYPVVLKEVQLRPHLAALQNCPGAVQVELSPDTDISSFFLLGPPCITAGCTKIRISTENCAIPVQMVRLHLKRPPDSPNLGISQILLLGHSPLSSANELNLEKIQWLSLLHFCLNRSDVIEILKENRQILSRVSSKLIENLINSFLCYRFSQTSFEQLVDCIVLLTEIDVDATSLQMIFAVVGKGCYVSNDSEIWLVELINRLCPIDAPISRISALIAWIFSALSSYGIGVCKLASRTLSIVVWCTACVCWRSTTFASVQLPTDLVKCMKNVINTSADADLKKSCGYLLSTVCYWHTTEFTNLLSHCGFEKLSSNHRFNKSVKKTVASSIIISSSSMAAASDDTEFCGDSNASSNMSVKEKDLNLLTRASENPTCVRILLQTKILSYLSSRLSNLCQEGKPNYSNILTLVEFFVALSGEEIVKEWLLSGDGSEFWTPLLSCLCNPSSTKTSSALTNVDDDVANVVRRLENATVLLLYNCIRFKVDGQRLFSQILCNLLSRSTGGLSSSLQQLILRILLEDERVRVVFEDKKFYAPTVNFTHPKFSCGIHLDVREISAHSFCQDLLPSAAPRKSTSMALKKPSNCTWSMNNIYYDYAPSASVSVSPFTDVINAGDKAKAKRLASKSASTSAFSSSGGNKYSQIQPIAYLCCPTLTNKDCLPGKLTLTQLLNAVQSTTKKNIDYLWLKIDYASPSEINEKINESLLSTSSISTVLKVFANMGGLALLAQHLQLYQPSFSLQNTKNTSYYNENELKILEDIDNSAAKQYLADDDVIDSYDAAYDWVTLMPPGDDGSGMGMQGTHIKPAYDRLRSIINLGLSPHVAVCFGVFLRLPGYAELLVTQNNRQAQWLLRLALGVTSDGSGVNILTSNDASTLTTLPFDVLSNLYSSRKWQTDDGRWVRQASLELGIVQLLLSCLAAFSHHPPRHSSNSADKPDVVRLVDHLLNTLANTESSLNQSADDKSQLYWAKGTGFGTGSTQRQWNIDLHILKQKQDEQNITCLLKVLTNFLYPGDILDAAQSSSNDRLDSALHCPPTLEASVLARSLVRSLFDSCLIATLQAYLRNDSVLDMSRHTAVYDSVMRVICSIALCPQLRPILFENSEQQSLKSLLYKLKDCVDTYVSKLEPLKRENALQQSTSEDTAAEEGLLKLVPLIELAARLVHNLNTADDTDSSSMMDDLSKNLLLFANMSVEEKYMKLMKPMQYDSTKFFDDHGSFAVPFHYESSIKSAGKDSGALAPRVRRLAQEAVTLSTSLPLSYSSSVFVRCAEERLDVMKVLITGPSGTPYADGCFEFDVWFPNDYPNSPMHINLQTTGGNTVRFNPNLYNDGKVCLSILNTWHGRPEERWNAQTSSFLQVLVSIQSLILVPDPYFNEPGYERTRGTPAGQQASRDYDANIRIATVRWAMLEMLRCPPAGFKQVIQRHFWLKKDEILRLVESWIAEMTTEGTGTAEKRMQRSTATQALKRHYYALKEEFTKMTCPLLEGSTSTIDSCTTPTVGAATATTSTIINSGGGVKEKSS